MNEPSNTPTPVILPAKRKRGRPRKDGNLPKKDEGSSKSASVEEGVRTVQQIESKSDDGSMIGRMVCGVIDGSFDAGYFLSVRIGNNGPFLRGVIFEPGRFTPVTSSNDIAPQAKMFQRREVPVPIPGQQNPINDVGSQSAVKQPVVLRPVLPCVPQPSPSSLLRNQNQSPQSMMLIGNMSNNNVSSPTLAEKMMIHQHQASISTYGNQFQSSAPVENLRMVEQNEAMQVYEVSVQSEGLLVDTEPAKDMISESSSEARANNVLHHKEVSNQSLHKQDVGSGLDQSSSQFRNDFNCLTTENHEALETQNRQSEVKQNQHPYYELHQHTVVETGFQPRELTQDKLQDINLELHETPVVTQTLYVPSENQHVKPAENEIRGPEHEMNRTSANTPHSISLEPANVEDQLDPGKLVHNELGSKNHGIKEAFVPSNSHFLPRELLPQSVESVTEKPSTSKNDIEDLQPEAKTSENNQSVHGEKPIRNSTFNGELDYLTAQKPMPFDLEIAAGETTWAGRHENQVSGFTARNTELNIMPGNTVLRTETENNPGGLSESQQI